MGKTDSQRAALHCGQCVVLVSPMSKVSQVTLMSASVRIMFSSIEVGWVKNSTWMNIQCTSLCRGVLFTVVVALLSFHT